MKKSDRYFLYLMVTVMAAIVVIVVGLRIRLEFYRIKEANERSLVLVEFSKDEQKLLQQAEAFKTIIVSGLYDIEISKAPQFELWVDPQMPRNPSLITNKMQLVFAPVEADDEQKSYRVIMKLPPLMDDLEIIADNYSQIVMDDTDFEKLVVTISNRSALFGQGSIAQKLEVSANLGAVVNFEAANFLSSGQFNLSSGARVVVNSNGPLVGSVSSNSLLEYKGSAVPRFLKSNGGDVLKIME